MKESLFDDIKSKEIYIEILIERIKVLEQETNERLDHLENRVFTPVENIGRIAKILGELIPQVFASWFMILGQAGALLFASLSLIYIITYFFNLILN